MRRVKTKDQLDNERRDILSESYKIMYRGRKVLEILTSEGWNKFVVPYIESEIERLTEESRFNPAKGDHPSVERLAFLNSFNSGAIFMLSSLQEEMHRWVNMGEEAQGKVKSMEKQ